MREMDETRCWIARSQPVAGLDSPQESFFQKILKISSSVQNAIYQDPVFCGFVDNAIGLEDNLLEVFRTYPLELGRHPASVRHGLQPQTRMVKILDETARFP